MFPRAHSSAFICICFSIGCIAGCAGDGSKKLLGRIPFSSAPTSAQTLEVQTALARTLERQGDFEQAENAYRMILSQHPEYVTAVHRLAVLADRRQQFDESARLFQQALELQPSNADLFCDLGYSFYLQQRLPEAEINFEQAIALNRHHERAHNHLGMLLAQTDRREEALVEFGKAGCNEAESHLNLAVALASCNQIADAHREFQKAQYVSSGDKEVEEKIARVEQLFIRLDSRNAPAAAIAARPGRQLR